MRPAHWILLLALCVLCVPGARAAHAGDSEALERVQRLGDFAPSQLFYALAEKRDAEAFSNLKQGLRGLTDASATSAAYGACSLFKGSAIEGSVIHWLEHQAFKARSKIHQVAATEALTYFWQPAEEELLRVLQNHPQAACRQAALPSMVPVLVAQRGRSACKLLIENAAGLQSDRTLLLGALRNFDSKEEETCMAKSLRDKRTSQETKLMLLDALASRETTIAVTAIERRLEDEDEVIRLRALEWLAKEGDAEQLKRLRPIAMTGSPDFVVKAMLVLAKRREGDPAWVGELYSFTQSQNTAVRLGATRALGRVSTKDALRLLHKLLRDKDLEVRLAAVDQVRAQHQLESVPKLIGVLADPRDLFTHEVAHCLRLLTGEDHGVSRKRWNAWFEDAGATLQLPTAAEGQRLEQERNGRKKNQGTTASFYGVQVDSRHVCFVLDTSGSMEDAASGRGTTSRSGRTTRMEVAKRELSNTLNQLLNGVHFNIITFDSKVTSYEKSLIELTPKSRQKALKAIEKWRAGGGTAIYNGLRRALYDPDVETIYLMTDGVPTEGDIVAEDEIRARIRELIEGRGIRIHGIAIGKSSSLLRGLAKDSGGQYIKIY